MGPVPARVHPGHIRRQPAQTRLDHDRKETQWATIPYTRVLTAALSPAVDQFAILEFISGILLTALAYALGTSGDSTSGAIAPIILMIAGFRFYVVSQGVRLLKELRHGPPLPTTIPRARPEPDRAPHLQTAHRV